jgi:hypothetical protein
MRRHGVRAGPPSDTLPPPAPKPPSWAGTWW